MPDYWTLVPCVSNGRTFTKDDGSTSFWTASCHMIEGYRDDEHSHWLSPDGTEFITAHRAGESIRPNGHIRTSKKRG